ncbi:hypothetical protein [Streptomyces sp. NPDC048350]|uniref:hypothetical protein n=1 Tax=Streptomyces sp. NPDC048350 TaxID=3365538 RepID=UPI003711C94F
MASEISPAEIRAAALEALNGPGERRRRLLAELAETEEELRPLIARAVRAEVPHRQIQEVTGISRPTIGKIARDSE